MLKKSTSLGKLILDAPLLSYYINLPHLSNISGHESRLIYDKQGIPLYVYDLPLGPRYNPTTVALFALKSYQLRDMESFRRAVRWLIDHGRIRGKALVWYITFPFPPRAERSMWVSGMTQGLVASVMARAFYAFKDKLLLKYAVGAVKGMLIPLKEGGPLLVRGEDIWIEEYPLERPPKHVLNGFIFSILGIRDVYLITGERDYYDLFLRCTTTLRRNMHLFDLGLWSKYDASVIAPPHYHFLNTLLVYVIGLLVNAEDLLATAWRWMVGYRTLGKVAGVALGNIAFKACLRRLLSALRLI